jgi:WD40-like Beta Propeller Repeat
MTSRFAFARCRRLVALASSLCAAAIALGAETKLIDVASDGGVAASPTLARHAISADGRYVAFTSSAGNLVAGVPAGPHRVYLRDTVTNTTILVSRTSQGGVPMVGSSFCGSISFEGRFVVFSSTEALTPNSPGGFVERAYIFDRYFDSVELVSVSDGGVAGHGAFSADTRAPLVTFDGRYVLFESTDDLAPNAGSIPTVHKVYRRDRVAQQTMLVSQAPQGFPANSHVGGIIADGSRMLFRCIGNAGTTPTPGLYVRDLNLGITQRIDVDPNNGTPMIQVNLGGLDWTADGTRVVVASPPFALPGIGDFDTNPDIYSIDWMLPAVTVVSKKDGNQDTNAACTNPTISDDGRYIAFQTLGTSVVPWTSFAGFSDIALRDLVTQRNLLVNISTSGAQAFDADSTQPMISGNGRHVSFVSSASGLVSGATGTHYYIRDRLGFANLGYGKPGSSHAIPNLSGSGSTAPGGSGSISLIFAAPFAQAILFASLDRNTSILTTGPLKSTVFVPLNPILVVPLMTDGFGGVNLPYTLPTNVPLVPEIYLQYAIADPLAIGGASVSNALLMGL